MTSDCEACTAVFLIPSNPYHRFHFPGNMLQCLPNTLFICQWLLLHTVFDSHRPFLVWQQNIIIESFKNMIQRRSISRTDYSVRVCSSTAMCSGASTRAPPPSCSCGPRVPCTMKTAGGQSCLHFLFLRHSELCTRRGSLLLPPWLSCDSR